MDMNKNIVKIPQVIVDLVNQVFEIEKKVNNLKEENSLNRNINRIKTLFEENLLNQTNGDMVKLSYHNPINEEYKETRTDCDITILGDDVNDLIIVEVVKPIIYCTLLDNQNFVKKIVQKGVVIVKSKNI